MAPSQAFTMSCFTKDSDLNLHVTTGFTVFINQEKQDPLRKDTIHT